MNTMTLFDNVIARQRQIFAANVAALVVFASFVAASIATVM
jgi:hypothetical protein